MTGTTTHTAAHDQHTPHEPAGALAAAAVRAESGGASSGSATPGADAPGAPGSTRPHHGPGETSDSPQRPSQRLSGRVLDFNLEQEVARLHGEPAWQRGQRNAITLAKAPEFRVILTVLKAGAHVQEHQVGAGFTLQGISGRVRVHLPGEAIDIVPGQLLVLESGIAHDVEALQESAFLLTIAWAGGQGQH